MDSQSPPQAADPADGLGRGHGPFQVDEFRGHDAAHRLLRIFEELVDEPAGLGPGVFQHPLDHAGGQLLQQIHRVVHGQLLQDAGQLPVGEGDDDHLLGVRGEIGKDLRRLLLGQRAEGQRALFLGQALQKIGQIHRVLLRQNGRELTVALVPDQLQAALQTFLVLHWQPPFCQEASNGTDKAAPAPRRRERPVRRHSQRAHSTAEGPGGAHNRPPPVRKPGGRGRCAELPMPEKRQGGPGENCRCPI